MSFGTVDLVIFAAIAIPLALIILGKVKKLVHILLLLAIVAVCVATKIFGLL